MRRDLFARPALIVHRTAKRVAGVSAESKSEGKSIAEVRAHRHAEGVDLSVVRGGQVPKEDPVPERTEQLVTFDLPRALGSGATRSHKLDEDKTTQSEPLTGNLARRGIPLFHFGRAK